MRAPTSTLEVVDGLAWPVKVLFRSALPRMLTGKVDRMALLRLFTS